MTAGRACIVLACIAGIAPATASAADPGRWVVTSTRSVAPYYRQGLASDPAVNVFFSGSDAGVYRTRDLAEQARNTSPIPPDVAQTEKYNHIGDIAWDAAEGGRLLLPLESYTPFAPDPNPSKTGSVAVMDPQTLKWRYYVKLNPAEIPKTQWLATDAPRGLVWTLAGSDLLAYRLADINAANAAPAAQVISAVRRIPGVAPGGAGGAAVLGGRIYLSTRAGGVDRIVSVEPGTGATQVEAELAGNNEPEGMDAGAYLGGLLHWEMVPGGGLSAATLVGLVPQGAPLRVKLSKGRVRAGRLTPLTATVTAATTGYRVPLAGVRVSIAGRSAKTGGDGRAKLSVKLTRGSYAVLAFLKGLRSGTRRLRAI
jgi:hypothetical protein